MFLIKSAIGDAYGAGFEFVKKPYPIPLKNDGQTFFRNPRYVETGGKYFTQAGWFTDDTEMSLAVAETLIENKIEDLNKEKFVQKFIELFNTEKREGYASRFYDFLLTVKDTKDFMNRIISTSDRNGATMRSGPLGYLKNTTTLQVIAEMQASITHDTPGSIMSSQIIALMYHYNIYKLGSKKDILTFVKDAISSYYSLRSDIHPTIWLPLHDAINYKKGPTSLNGFEASLSVIDIFVNNNDEHNLLIDAIDRGGDTDTSASIALGLAHISDEYEHNLSEKLQEEFKTTEPQYERLKNVNYELDKTFIPEYPQFLKTI